MKKYLLVVISVILLVLFSWVSIIHENNLKISSLEDEIFRLEIEKNNLLEDKIKSIEELEDIKINLENVKTELEELEELEEMEVKSRDLGLEVVVTSYDLSVDSCGKSIGSKGYGITASGTSLVGETWKSARAIAVDPKVIPLGSEVDVKFTDEDYKKYDGVYKAVDTGSAIKGNKIDFFMGDFNQNKAHQSVWDFGKTKANIKIIN